MDKRRFPATMLAGQDDFDALHDYTESALATFVRALGDASTDPEYLLFANRPPEATGSGPWTVVVPAQPIAVAGVPALLAEQSLTVADPGDRDVAVFLRIRKTSENEDRAYLDAAAVPPGAAAGTASFTVARLDVAEAVLVDPYTGPSDDLAPDDDDVGPPMLLAVLTIDGVDMTVDHDPSDYLWQVPTSLTPAEHAASHLPGGADPIDLATPSDGGLISADDLGTVREAVTAVSIATASPYLVRTTEGDNVADPKEVTLELRCLSDTFRAETEGGQSKLALNFASGGTYGTSKRPARADHAHGLEGSPLQVALTTLTVDAASQLGTAIQLSVPANIAQVLSVVAAWAPPGISAPLYPQIEAAWAPALVAGSLRRVGTKFQQRGARDVWLQLGDYALCELTASDLARALAATSGGLATWASASLGVNWPQTGSLVVRIVGLRVGVAL